MKTEVYSWRLSASHKADLEEEARRKGKSLGGLLHDITSEWLESREKDLDYEAHQAAIRARTASAIGAISGNDPTRSSRVSELMGELLAHKHSKESRARRRSD
jgi:hypothetical protein